MSLFILLLKGAERIAEMNEQVQSEGADCNAADNYSASGRFTYHQLPPCRAALQNFVGSVPSLNRWRAVFLHTPRAGSSPLIEQTSSMNVPSPLGMGLMAAGVTSAVVGEGLGVVGDGLGDGLGVGAGVDAFAIWSPVLLTSGCLGCPFISDFGGGFFSALLPSSFLAEFFAVSLVLLAASLA